MGAWMRVLLTAVQMHFDSRADIGTPHCSPPGINEPGSI